MTAAEWDACDDPDRMLTAAAARLTDRQLLLFGCGAARRVWDRLPEQLREAVPLVEKAADAADPGERSAAMQEALSAAVGQAAAVGLAALYLQPRFTASFLIRHAARHLRRLELLTPDELGFSVLGLLVEDHPSPTQAAVLRCVAGNPFRKARVRPAWRTADVLTLAAGIAADRAFDRLPILADALQDAGCTDDRLLTHLRSEGPHVHGCWAVERVLGKG